MIKDSLVVLCPFIEKRRKELKISQAIMAKELGISRRQYMRMESGKSKMSIEILEQVSEILGVKLLMIDKALLA